MKVLMICGTYMQVLIAIQLKLKLLQKDTVDLVLHDHSTNADKVAEGLRKTGLFRRVIYVNTKYFTYNQSKFADLKDVFDLFRKTGKYFKPFQQEEDFIYDKFYYYVPDMIVFSAFETMLRNSKGRVIPEMTRFEEGVLCYRGLINFQGNGRMRLLQKFYKLLGRKYLLDKNHKFLCFYPDILRSFMTAEQKASAEIITLPFLTSEKDFLQAVNTAFSYDPAQVSFPQKYIYFATSTDIDGNSVGETDLILQLADLVGKDNLLVKPHPRDDRDIFLRNGLNVLKNSAMPWELVQLNYDFSNHVFVSLSSGSILNITAMKCDTIPSYYLYPLAKGRNAHIDAYFNDIDNILGQLHNLGTCQALKPVTKLGDVIS